ncbi:hypothetical protein Tco_0586353 [Tanacetum coccineum]
MVLEKKVNIKAINYAELNRLSEEFGKHFVPQQELSDEQAFRLQTSHPNTDQSASSPVKIEAPRELPKVSLVNTSLKKLKYHLGQFDNAVKSGLRPMLSQKGNGDILNIVVNSLLDINTSVNVNSSIAMKDSINYVKMCNKCLELETGLIKQHNMVEKDKHNRISKSFSKLEQHCISLELVMQLNKEIFQKNNTSVNQTEPSFDQLLELNNLKAKLQAKDTTIENIKNDLRKFKGKDIVDNVVQVSNATAISLGMYKLDPVTLDPKDKNNRETHIYYLKHTMEQAAILRKIVEQAKSLNPLDSASYSAYKSKSTDNTKNDRILQISSSTPKKNKVKDHSRIVKSCLNKPNYVVEPSGNANVQHSKLNTNSELMCIKCNSSMFDARHELCFLEFVSDMNVSSKSKSVKTAKKKEEWKPTGKLFFLIGYNWRPTGRTFTLVGNVCSLTRITATNKVPLRELIPLEVVVQEFVVTKVYTRRPKVPKTNGSNSKPKIAKYVISNNTKPDTSRRSNTSVAPYSSSVDLSLSKLFCGIWTPDAQST